MIARDLAALVGGQLCGCKHLLQVLLDAVRDYPSDCLFRERAVCAIAYCFGEFAYVRLLSVRVGVIR